MSQFELNLCTLVLHVITMKVTVDSFLKYYQALESRPIFGTVEEMLKWAGLYNLTTRTLHEELTDAGLSSLLIDELATVSILLVNYTKLCE